MKLTEKKAIKLSIELWQWLYDNPDKYKESWPKYKKYNLQDMDGRCFCCEWYNEQCKHEYIKRKNNRLYLITTQHCPLNSIKLCGFACIKSAFRKWTYALYTNNTKQSKSASLKILNALKKKYASISE